MSADQCAVPTRNIVLWAVTLWHPAVRSDPTAAISAIHYNTNVPSLLLSQAQQLSLQHAVRVDAPPYQLSSALLLTVAAAVPLAPHVSQVEAVRLQLNRALRKRLL
jgi:hypothetical protein